MAIVEYEKNGYLISTNKNKLDIGLIHDFLANASYWAEGRLLDVVRKSIQYSLCFGMYEGDRQIGFGRVITDYATFAYICDLFILESHRGQGLGKWLVESIVRHPDLQSLPKVMLTTRDAHAFYQASGGFQSLQKPEWMMERVDPEQNLE